MAANIGRRAKFKSAPKRRLIDNTIEAEGAECSAVDSINFNNDKEPENGAPTYGTHDKGPYYVHVESETIEPIKVGVLLTKQNFKDIVDVKIIGKGKLKILTLEKKTSNKIVKWSESVTGLNAYIPDFYLKTYGIIRGLATDVDIDEMTQYAKCERGHEKILVENMERIHKWNREEKKLEPTRSVKVTFRCQKLPEVIAVHHIKFQVSLFERRPLQCINCMRYGHSKKRCKSKQLCANCLEETHQKTDCQNQPKCVYCDGKHSTFSRECEERVKQQQITNVMDIEKIPFREAKLKLQENVNDFPRLPALNFGAQSSGLSFADTVIQANEKNDLLKIIKQKDEQINKLEKTIESLLNEIKIQREEFTEMKNQMSNTQQTSSEKQSQQQKQQLQQQQQIQQHQQLQQQQQLQQHQQAQQHQQESQQQQQQLLKQQSQPQILQQQTQQYSQSQRQQTQLELQNQTQTQTQLKQHQLPSSSKLHHAQQASESSQQQRKDQSIQQQLNKQQKKQQKLKKSRLQKRINGSSESDIEKDMTQFMSTDEDVEKNQEDFPGFAKFPDNNIY